jgi:hypothetical protein
MPQYSKELWSTFATIVVGLNERLEHGLIGKSSAATHAVVTSLEPDDDGPPRRSDHYGPYVTAHPCQRKPPVKTDPFSPDN